jgi:hypothetical protein
MRDERLAQRCSSDQSNPSGRGDEAGTIIVFVALGMLALLLFLALALDQGVRYSGRTQLQQLVDSAAQAALSAISVPGATRADATQAAQDVLAMTPVSQGVAPSDLQIEFGRFSFNDGGGFQPETTTDGPPQAVRVSIDRTGPNAFKSLVTGSPIAINASSVAALRCRNLVFVQDVSSSFKEDIGKVQTALRQVVAILALQDAFSGIETRVGLVAFRNIVVEAATTPLLVRPADFGITSKIDALDDSNVLCSGRIEREGLTRIVVPACVGSDMRGALERAEQLITDTSLGKNQACEDLVLTISDGVPCKVTPQNLDQTPGVDVVFGPALPGEPQGGGSTPEETLAYVNAEMRTFGSIAVLTANSGRTVNPSTGFDLFVTDAELQEFLQTCPTNPNDGDRQFDVEFARSLISGFGQSFESNRDANGMAREMTNALQTIPPVVVR